MRHLYDRNGVSVHAVEECVLEIILIDDVAETTPTGNVVTITSYNSNTAELAFGDGSGP
jgi:hypothetical protein